MNYSGVIFRTARETEAGRLCGISDLSVRVGDKQFGRTLMWAHIFQPASAQIWLQFFSPA
jgi:hypothetical protein